MRISGPIGTTLLGIAPAGVRAPMGDSLMAGARALVSIVLLAAALSAAPALRAQHLPVGDPVEDYVRVMEMLGRSPVQSHVVRTLVFANGDFEGPHAWSGLLSGEAPPAELDYSLLGPRTSLYRNSLRPWGQNDGVVWAGRGVTTAYSAGTFGRYGYLEASVRPIFVRTANEEFDLHAVRPHPRLRPYGYPHRTDIDLPQRFGDEPFSTVHAGESYVQLRYGAAAAGFSTENMWWGPGQRNAIIMSNNAPGFRHAFLRTLEPLQTRIGTIEGMWIWGSVGQSDYFQDVTRDTLSNDLTSSARRFLTGLVLAYQPRWLPGLFLGAAQSYMVHPDNVKFADYFGVINIPFYNDTGRHDNAMDDKMVSLFARWAPPGGGFEVYGEWARGDHTSDFRDFFVAPDHARGFTLGFQRVYALTPRYYTRFLAEHTFLEANREAGFRDRSASGDGYFYTHGGIRPGYTHRGQVMGAGIGPGSQGQYFRFDIFGPFGRAGLFGLRQVFDNDLYTRLKDNNYEHEVSLAGGVSWFTFYRGFELGGEIGRVKTFNRSFNFDNVDWNTNVQVTVRWVRGYR